MRTNTRILAILFLWTGGAIASPSPDAFGALPDFLDAAISPDATQYALIVNVDGEYAVQVSTIDALDERVRAVGLAAGVKPRWIKWVNNERVLVELFQYERIRGSAAWSSFLYSLNVKTMKGKILIHPKDVIRQDNADVVDFLDDDPDYILMAFSDQTQRVSDIQRVHVETGLYRRIKRGLEEIQFWYTDHRGEPRIGQGRSDRLSGEEKWNLRVRDANADRWQTEKDYPGLDPSKPIFGFTDDPNEVLIGAYNGKQTLGIYVYDLERKERTRQVFHHEFFDAGGIVTTSTGEVIGAEYVAETNETVLFDEYNTLMQQLREKMQGYQLRLVDRSNDGNRILFTAENSSDPGALLMADRSGRLRRVAMANSQLPKSEMGRVFPVKYTARDGIEIPAYITLPPSMIGLNDTSKAPFVVLPHGGPYARSYQRFDYFAQFFASRGFVVLQMNFRGSAGYGESFKDAGRDNWVLMQEDIEDGTKWALQNGYADPDRTCIVGWSFGGYAALMGAIKNPDMYACAVSIAGVTDLQGLAANLRQYRFGSQNARNYILNGFENRHAIKENSPVKRADELTVPLFMAHGDEDLNVQIGQFERMRKALKRTKTKVEFMEFEGEDHYFSVQENRQKMLQGIDRFLRQVIGDSEHER